MFFNSNIYRWYIGFAAAAISPVLKYLERTSHWPVLLSVAPLLGAVILLKSILPDTAFRFAILGYSAMAFSVLADMFLTMLRYQNRGY